ncbi:MAG: hypothetical protein M1318_05765 [Firmicutes bacterium]|nr:hypothetical protein [Bacillota bacterium]
MRSQIPLDTKRSYTYLLKLDGMGLLIVGAGVFVLIGLLHEPWPLWMRIPVMIVIGLATAALAWGKWPPGEYGDRVGVWAIRIFHYIQEERHPLRWWMSDHSMKPLHSAKNRRKHHGTVASHTQQRR